MVGVDADFVAAPSRVAPTAEVDSDYQEFNFTGDAKSYFSVWIVNVLLSIITLGFYLPWAKIRRIQYFYNNTYINETPFNYHATGLRLLIGRVIAIIAIFMQIAAPSFVPGLAVTLGVILFFLLFWLINASLRFNARFTSYQNVRFGWDGTYWRTFLYAAIFPILGVLSLGLRGPVVVKKYYEYYFNKHRYGTTNFTLNASSKDFYKAYYSTLFLVVLVTGIIIGVMSTIVFVLQDTSFYDEENYIIVFVATSGFLISQTFRIVLGAKCRNIALNSLRLGNAISFKSSISSLKLLWITISNLVIAVGSLMLLVPYTKVRRYRYLCSCTHYRIERGYDVFVNDLKGSASAIGEEITSLAGLDISI